jgi:predicted HTH transcriptional regulator
MNNTYNILPTAESDRVEFKTTFNDEVIISLVAFSNTRGGAVYVGVSDNGDVKGSGIQNCSRRFFCKSEGYSAYFPEKRPEK